MHDAHLGCALFFLDMLAEYTLLSMTVMVAPCLWYVVGMKLVCPMSKFPQAPFARAPFGRLEHIDLLRLLLQERLGFAMTVAIVFDFRFLLFVGGASCRVYICLRVPFLGFRSSGFRVQG